MAARHFVFVTICVVVASFYSFEVGAIGYCPSYCDVNGIYHESRHCHSQPDIYCCGTAFHMACCPNRSHDISGWYPEKYNCVDNSWFQVHWQVMITMTGTIVLVMLFAGCCCQCCKICGQKARETENRIHFRSQTSNINTTVVADTDGNQFIAEAAESATGEPAQVMIQMFNPDNPYAFTPPEYESLPKEPPKYYEVFGPEGNMNPCYVPDTPPPSFTEATNPPVPTPPTMRQNGGSDASAAAGDSSSPDGASAEPVPTESQVVSRDQVASRNSEAQPLNPAGDFVEVDLTADIACRTEDVNNLDEQQHLNRVADSERDTTPGDRDSPPPYTDSERNPDEDER